MKLVKDVFEIAELFMKNPTYVQLNNSCIADLAKLMLTINKSIFPIPEIKNPFKAIIVELVAASVNYCYWYGRYNIRPCDGKVSSIHMYELLMDSFFDFEDHSDLEKCLERFGQRMAINRFPLLEERISHLKQLKKYAIDFCIDIENKYYIEIGTKNLTYFFTELVTKFPGFASDIFLKRASLFFIQLNRRFEWFEDELHLLHVPADYQLPKMLEYFKCISYNTSLKQAITQGELISKYSIQECEIRAATIITVKKLCELTGWNVADVDSFLFLRRRDVTTPFHLCITTDY